MNLLKNLLVLLSLIGFGATSYAAVNGVELASCSVFSEGDTGGESNGDKEGDNGGDKQTEEEEPDCE
ncbi:MAG: hypothetical protein KAJ32_04275 [Gammaproteobacteria bacterium]|nr:hypothetical protein [Gammaproteobacteria bacterium]